MSLCDDGPDVPFVGVLACLNTVTTDGRLIRHPRGASVAHYPFPVPLMYSDDPGAFSLANVSHTGEVRTLDAVDRLSLWGTGVLCPALAEIIRAHESLSVSVVMDDLRYVPRCSRRGDVLEVAESWTVAGVRVHPPGHRGAFPAAAIILAKP